MTLMSGSIMTHAQIPGTVLASVLIVTHVSQMTHRGVRHGLAQILQWDYDLTFPSNNHAKRGVCVWRTGLGYTTSNFAFYPTPLDFGVLHGYVMHGTF
jgi:hypothetical protein